MSSFYENRHMRTGALAESCPKGRIGRVHSQHSHASVIIPILVVSTKLNWSDWIGGDEILVSMGIIAVSLHYTVKKKTPVLGSSVPVLGVKLRRG